MGIKIPPFKKVKNKSSMKKIVFWNTVLVTPIFFVVFFCIETISFGRSIFSSQITQGEILSLLGFFLTSLFVTLVPFFFEYKISSFVVHCNFRFLCAPCVSFVLPP